MAHQIDSVIPNHGVVGDTVVINGTGFGAVQGASTVRFFSNKIATISIWSDTAITCIVPAASIIGPLRVIVGGLEVVSARNADFFWLDGSLFPATAVDNIEFQNVENDSDVPGDDLALADARDFNTLAEIAIRAQRKIGFNGDPNPDSLEFRVLGLASPLVIEDFEAVPPLAAPPPFAPALPLTPPGLLHTFIAFPPGSDTEVMIKFTVPRRVRPGSVLAITPRFQLSAAPGAPDVVTLDIEGDLNGVGLPPLGGPGVPYPVGAFPATTFITGPPITAIPVDGAPPFAPFDSKVALRIKRLLAGDTYGGIFLLDSIFVNWVR